MKLANKFFFPLFVLILLAVSAVGVAFAREASELDDNGPSGEIEIVGTIEAISDSSWTIDGQLVVVTALTEIKDTIVVGDMVKIHARVQTDGSLVAHEIELAGADDLGGDDNSNDNGDDDMDDDNGNDNSSDDMDDDNSNDSGYDDNNNGNGNDNDDDDNGNNNGGNDNGNGNGNDDGNHDDNGNNNGSGNGNHNGNDNDNDNGNDNGGEDNSITVTMNK